MSTTHSKKEFLCCISGGISVLANCSMLSDEIYAGQDDATELYIKDNILQGPSFSEEKFCKAMQTIDDQTLRELLKYFDDKDMSVSQAYTESCLGLGDLPPELTNFAESILDEEILTFVDFIDF